MLVSFCPAFAQSPATSHLQRKSHACGSHPQPVEQGLNPARALLWFCFITASVTDSLGQDTGAALRVSSCCSVSTLSDVPRLLCGLPSLVLRVTQSPVPLPGVNCCVFASCMLIFHRGRGCLSGADPADAEKKLA